MASEKGVRIEIRLLFDAKAGPGGAAAVNKQPGKGRLRGYEGAYNPADADAAAEGNALLPLTADVTDARATLSEAATGINTLTKPELLLPSTSMFNVIPRSDEARGVRTENDRKGPSFSL